VDAGDPIGSVQVPGGLEPIVLHRDAVSGGGYAMIGTVISADMDLIAQLQPNNKARFVSVDLEQALAARREYRARLDRLRAALSQ
jgi:allophanate hydrolase subunit 2